MVTQQTSKSKHVPGGWMDWITKLREANPGKDFSYREMITLYGKGVRWQDAFTAET